MFFLKRMTLSTMNAVLPAASFINYYLEDLHLNKLIGQRIRIESTGIIKCIFCHKYTKKTFFNGACWLCYKKLPECGPCISRPEKCVHHLPGTNHLEWALENCLKPHIVYLSYTSNLKVGVTKIRNVPSRWIDQGAVLALPIITTNNRFLAGIIEQKFCEHMSDKTSWQNMLLLSSSIDINLHEVALNICQQESEFLNSLQGIKIIHQESKTLFLNYPLIDLPVSKYLNIINNPIEGTLIGIKGQYLCLDTGVFNIRRFTGYECNIYISR